MTHGTDAYSTPPWLFSADRRAMARGVLAMALWLPLALSACGKVSPDTALAAAQPRSDPVRPVTPYSAALRCVRDELAGIAGPAITLAVGSVPDATGRITPGLRDMITSAIAEMTIGQTHYDLTEIAVRGEGLNPAGGVRPEPGGALIGLGYVHQSSGLQLIGSLSQADRSNQSSSVSVGGSYQANTIDAALTDDISTVALDLRLVDISRGLSVSQATRSMLAVSSNGNSANAGLTIGSFGLSAGYSFNRQEGAHQAVRTLVELSVAELLGQAARVPYWACLSIDRTHPLVQAQIARWYRGLSANELDADVRNRLSAAGYAVPEAPGAATAALLEFQRRSGLIPTGRPGFETYALLVSAQLPPGVSTGGMPSLPPEPSASAGRVVEPPNPNAVTPAAPADGQATTGPATLPVRDVPVRDVAVRDVAIRTVDHPGLSRIVLDVPDGEHYEMRRVLDHVVVTFGDAIRLAPAPASPRNVHSLRTDGRSVVFDLLPGVEVKAVRQHGRIELDVLDPPAQPPHEAAGS